MDQKIAVSLNIPFATQTQVLKTYKVAIRHVNAHALVNAAISVTLNGVTIATATVVYGGIAKRATRMSATEAFLVGKDITLTSVFQSALQVLQNEIQQKIVSDDRTAYRTSVATAFFYKFFLSQQPNLPSYLQSAAQAYERPVTGGARSFQTSP
jgi:xanthine dehydrogenase/oxidase